MTPQSPLVLMIVLSAVTAAVFARPAVWGFSGAVVYAGNALITTLKSETVTDQPKAAHLAWWQFVVTVFFGTVAAEAFGPTLANLTHGRLQPQAVWLAVGLSVNAVWPVLERTLGRRLSRIIDAIIGDRP